MTNATQTSLEVALESAYRQQAALYEQFLQLTTRLPAVSGVASQDVLGEMSGLMDRIAAVDKSIQTLREQWKSSAQKPGPGLAEALKTVESLIVKLMEKIDAAERAAQESRKGIVPKMSEENLRRRMRTAYASAARHE